MIWLARQTEHEKSLAKSVQSLKVIIKYMEFDDIYIVYFKIIDE
jgi:hypothetical protein